MRLLLINETHPATRHVAGMRVFHFAQALAGRGHQVIQLTGPQPAVVSSDNGTEQKSNARLISLVSPQERQLRLALLRRAQTALRFLRSDAAMAAWLDQSERVAIEAMGDFRPDVIWATFGKTNSLLLAQRLAIRFDAPWVIDVKDNWDLYNRAGLRGLVARRFKSTAGMTSNSQLHLAIAARYFPSLPSRRVYSGVAEPFFRVRQTQNMAVNDTRTLLLVGSIYQREVLNEYLSAVDGWLRGLPVIDRKQFRFRYVGGNHVEVSEAVGATGFADVCEVSPFVPLHELAGLVRDSFITSYLWFPVTFHHKLLELLVAAKAVIAFPGEHRESLELAAQSDTPFNVCGTVDEVRSALSLHWAAKHTPTSDASLPSWHWNDFAVGLEEFFQMIVSSRTVR